MHDAHIDAMLNGAMTLYQASFADGAFRWYFGNPTQAGELTLETADQVGAVLLAEHEESLRHLYGGETVERPYRFTLDRRPVDPLRILKTAKCYAYQSCEHPGWETSEARCFCDTLVNLAIDCLPGYRQAPWAVTCTADVLAAR